MESKELNALEERIFYRYGHDGAMETILGIALMLIGLTKVVDVPESFRSIVPLFVIVMILAWRKRITYPRLGYVEFSKERKTRFKRALIILLFVSILSVILAVWGANLISDSASGNPASAILPKRLISGVLLGFIIAAVGWFRRMNHLYYFSALAFVLFVLTGVFQWSTSIAFAGTGLAFLIFGLITLFRFLKEHPVQESANAG